MLRTVNRPASRLHHAALLEDEESIQASLMEVVNALLRGTIETKRAELILRALNTAVRNARRVKFGLHASAMVKEVPNYPAAADVEADPEVDEIEAANAARAEAAKQATRAEIARVRAAHLPTPVIDPTKPEPPASDKNAPLIHSHKQRARSR